MVSTLSVANKGQKKTRTSERVYIAPWAQPSNKEGGWKIDTDSSVGRCSGRSTTCLVRPEFDVVLRS